MKNIKVLMAAIVITGLWASSSFADTVTLMPSDYCSLVQADGNNQSLSRDWCFTGYYYGDAKGLIKYDLASAIPHAAGTWVQINSVTLKLHTVNGGIWNGSSSYNSATSDNWTDATYATTDNWSMSTEPFVTWATQPPMGATLTRWTSDACPWYPATLNYFSTSSDALAQYVEQEVNGDGVLSMIVDDVNAPDLDRQSYYIGASASTGAKLVVDYTVVDPVTVTGTVDLGSYTGPKQAVGLAVEFLYAGTVRTVKLFLNADGSFSIPHAAKQVVDIQFNGPFLLSKRMQVDLTVSGNENLGTIVLCNGDFNGDGAIDAGDLDLLADVWNLSGM